LQEKSSPQSTNNQNPITKEVNFDTEYCAVYGLSNSVVDANVNTNVPDTTDAYRGPSLPQEAPAWIEIQKEKHKASTFKQRKRRENQYKKCLSP